MPKFNNVKVWIINVGPFKRGAAMALPIYGFFMQKVYADKSLGYSETENFVVPEQFQNPCATIDSDDKESVVDHDEQQKSSGIDKMFQ